MMHEAGVERAVIVPPHPQLAMTADHLGVTGDIVKEGKPRSPNTQTYR